MSNPTILVTGDSFIKRHIYEDHSSGCLTRIVDHGGGAVMLRKLLDHASAKEKGSPFSVGTGVNEKLKKLFPQALSLWAPRPGKEKGGAKNWHFSRSLGCSGAGNQTMPANLAVASSSAQVMLINDAGFYFRHGNNRDLWPEAIRTGKPKGIDHIVLTMTAPLGHGDLWRELSKNFQEKLVVIVSLEEMHKEETGITTGISWERTLEEMTFELQNNGAVTDLLRCRHLIVRIGNVGALWVDNSTTPRSFMAVIDPIRQDTWSLPEREETSLTFAAAIALNLALGGSKTIPSAIRSGVRAIRNLYTLGFIEVPKQAPSFPFLEIANDLSAPQSGLVDVAVPNDRKEGEPSWSIMGQEMSNNLGIARRVALFGPRALGAIPYNAFGKLTVVDRGEIESLCGIRRLMKGYVDQKKTERPLSIAVFGAPGSGKSFGIKQIAKEMFGQEFDQSLLEFNLSQFAGPDELAGALHQVRDKVLEGLTPLVFWDEFDSKQFLWLQYLLAPMQDGKFQEGQITHPVGKCIFVFAGGTSYTMEDFTPPEENKEAAAKFKLVKGPDFVSRLNGYLNVLGPNPRQRFDRKKLEWVYDDVRPDRCYPIRRALLIRSMLRIGSDQNLAIDQGVLTALLEIDCYKHGARSLETVINLSKTGTTIHRCNLPPQEQLSLHVDYEKFMALVRRELGFRMNAEGLARGIHENFIALSKKQGTKIEYDVDFAELPPDIKASNVAAAARIPVILGLAGLKVEAGEKVATPENEEIEKIIGDHIEVLAEAEHNGWMEEKLRNGWSYGPKRANELKLHPLIIPYKNLPEEEKEKDRDAVTNYPNLVKNAGYAVVKANVPQS
jgi:hypothetical protein